MSLETFESLPDEARLWIYGTNRRLSSGEQSELLDTLDDFFSEWMSHGRPVEGRAVVLEDRFLLVAAAVEEGEISGCGIDSSTQVIDEVADTLEIDWVPALTIFYRHPSGEIRGVSRPEFRKLVEDGVVSRTTGVIDLSLESLGDLREQGFERPAGESWHALVFRIPEAA